MQQITDILRTKIFSPIFVLPKRFLLPGPTYCAMTAPVYGHVLYIQGLF
ncbi:hypothetical protein [Paenibacillus sp. XY044]|nr:hypothetical protein [Paenibacillus sp. XY044]